MDFLSSENRPRRRPQRKAECEDENEDDDNEWCAMRET